MSPKVYILLLVALAISSLVQSLELKPDKSYNKNEEMCKNLTRNPYFEPEMIMGAPWRIYYSWNMKLDKKCMDMKFKKATPMIIDRVWKDMYDYMEHQPIWDSAVLHVTMGNARHEMLLFPDQGAAGNFLGVPNVVRDGNLAPMRNTVPLLKFHLKFIKEGKFLLMVDCHIGVSTLSARTIPPPYRSEIASSAAELDIGDGYPACTIEKNKDEQFIVK